MATAKQKIQSLLRSADIIVNGNRSWDMQVHDERLYNLIMRQGSLGLGTAYMEGWWDATQLDHFFYRVLRARLEHNFSFTPVIFMQNFLARICNLQNKTKAFKNVKHHYDIGNDLYKAMLDKRLLYTCAYWNNAQNLDEAQEAKLDLICRKLQLQPGQRVLDIGCGWGGFAKFAAEKYDVNVVGITVSREQVKLAKECCKGLPVEIRLQDYRELDEQFDHIVSLGMMEHVGYKNYNTYINTVTKCLSAEGIFLLQVIGNNISVKATDPWLNTYIFPNSMLPSIRQIGEAIEGKMIMEDWQNLSVNYDKTLMAWFKNFDAHWDELKNKYGDRFYRMWKYYLLSCAGGFRARKTQLWQIALSKCGLDNGFVAPRYQMKNNLEKIKAGDSVFIK